MSGRHDVAFEAQDLADAPPGLVAILDDEDVDALVDRFDVEVKIRNAAQAFAPVVAQLGLARDDAVGLGQEHVGQRRGENDIVAEVRQHPFDVVGIP